MKHLLQSYLTELRSGHQDYTTEHYCFRQFVKADAHPLFAASQNPQFIDILPALKGGEDVNEHNFRHCFWARRLFFFLLWSTLNPKKRVPATSLSSIRAATRCWKSNPRKQSNLSRTRPKLFVMRTASAKSRSTKTSKRCRRAVLHVCVRWKAHCVKVP